MLLRLITLVTLTLVHLFFLVSTKDLNQINRDELFLDKVHLEAFRHFQEKIQDAPLLAMDLTLKEGIESKLPFLFKELDLIQNEGVTVRSFFDIYQKKVNRNDLKGAFSFVEANPQLAFPFLNRDHFTVLFLLPREWSWHQNHIFVDKIVKTFSIDHFQADFTGTPYINYQLNLKSQAIKTEIFPILFSVCFLLTYIIIGQFVGALLIFIPSLFAAASTLMFSQLIFHELNMITSIIPVLNFILNLTLGYHLYCTYLKERSFEKVLKRKMSPIFLMILTTAIGFGSLYFSQVEAIRQMSITSSIGLIFTSAIHLLWAYLAYEMFDHRRPLTISKWGENFVNKFNSFINAKKLFILGSIIAISGIFLANKIIVMTEAAHYFTKESGIRYSMDRIHSQRLGNPNFELIMNLNEDHQDYENLNKIHDIETQILKLFPEHKLLSLNSFIIEANFLYSGQNIFPTNSMSYGLLRGGIDQDLSHSFMNENIYRMTFAGPFLSNEEFLQKNQELESFLNQNKIPATLGGLYYTLRMSQNSLILILVKSFTISLFVIILLAFIHFRDFKILSSFFLANVIPALMSLFLMWLTGLTINIATVMTFSISIGIIVDGSFHIAHAIKSGESNQSILKESLVPIFMSSAILILSFLLFAFYGFLPIRHFGLTLAINIFMGLLFDLKVLPWLLKRDL